LEWDYPFLKDMQNDGVDNVIWDMCMFLCREIFHAEDGNVIWDMCMFLCCEIFHVEGAFFDKNGSLTEFPQLYTYERYVV
jgi:hypothetical protein